MDYEHTKLKCFGAVNEKMCPCLFLNFRIMKLGCLKDYEEHPPDGRCDGYINMLVNKWKSTNNLSGVAH